MRVKIFHETSGEGISLISSNWNRGVVFFEITLFNFVDTVPRICSILPQIRSLSICQLHNGCDQQFHAKENKYRKAKLGKTKKQNKNNVDNFHSVFYFCIFITIIIIIINYYYYFSHNLYFFKKIQLSQNDLK